MREIRFLEQHYATAMLDVAPHGDFDERRQAPIDDTAGYCSLLTLPLSSPGQMIA